MQTVIKVRWIIIKDEKIFLLWNDKKLMYPWWKQEIWETIQDTFYREMLEETWVKAEIDKFLWFKEYINQNWQISIQFLFLVKNTDDFENINRAKCSHAYEWNVAWFFDIKFLEKNWYDFPKDLPNIMRSIEFDYSFSLNNLFIK
jgi:ADP-ribose pyrophosphatase YjhB (NUDIX family)